MGLLIAGKWHVLGFSLVTQSQTGGMRHLDVLCLKDQALMSHEIHSVDCWALRGYRLLCRVADGTISMDEAMTRHKQLLRRQHFGREPPNVRKFF